MGSPRKPGIAPQTALMFQGGIGVLGLIAILLFDISVPLVGPGLWQSIVYGTLGAAGTYTLLLLMTRIPYSAWFERIQS